jgi:ABC-type antimicrobial peptide transport system permease subunit
MTSLLGVAALIVLISREISHRSSEHQRIFKIMRALGVSHAQLSLIMMIFTLATLLPSIFISVIIVKLIVYDLLVSSIYLAWPLLLLFSAVTLGLVLLASFILLLYRVKKISASLSEIDRDES